MSILSLRWQSSVAAVAVVVAAVSAAQQKIAELLAVVGSVRSSAVDVAVVAPAAEAGDAERKDQQAVCKPAQEAVAAGSKQAVLDLGLDSAQTRRHTVAAVVAG